MDRNGRCCLPSRLKTHNLFWGIRSFPDARLRGRNSTSLPPSSCRNTEGAPSAHRVAFNNTEQEAKKGHHELLTDREQRPETPRAHGRNALRPHHSLNTSYPPPCNSILLPIDPAMPPHIKPPPPDYPAVASITTAIVALLIRNRNMPDRST